jgi:hypothetical protein
MPLGDFNHLDLSQICIGNHLKQVVKLPTCQGAILDKIVTNIHRHNDNPVICSPVGCSDHSTVLWKPTAPHHQLNMVIERVVQPLKSHLFEYSGSGLPEEIGMERIPQQQCRIHVTYFIRLLVLQ